MKRILNLSITFAEDKKKESALMHPRIEVAYYYQLEKARAWARASGRTEENTVLTHTCAHPTYYRRSFAHGP